MPDTTPPPKPRPKWPLAIVALLALAIGGYFLWRTFFRAPVIPPGVVALSGRVEGDDSAISPKVSGRIRELTVREGDLVKAGQVVAILDDQQIRAREEQAQATLDQAEARIRTAQRQVAVVQEQLRQTELTVGQSKLDAEGRIKEAEARIASAQATLAEAEANYKLSLFDRDAYTKLASTGAVSERQGKEAESKAESQAAVVNAARREVEAARGSLTTAQANLSNPNIRAAQAAGVRQQVLQQQADVAAAQADAARARAALSEARANRRDLEVIAPFDGTVATRAAEPGEVVQAGAALLTLIDLNKVYLRGFVPEGQIGLVRVGQQARVYLDSAPGKPLTAFVSRVDPQASFTPENTYFRDDRVKQVVGVKLQLKEGRGYAKPGMPADGEILAQGDQWPAERPRK